MCKIMVVPHVPETCRANVEAFIKAAGKPMSQRDRDGIGFAALSKDGELYGARWADKDKFLDYTEPDLKAWQAAYDANLAAHQRELARHELMMEAAPDLVGDVLKLPDLPKAPEIGKPPEWNFFWFGKPIDAGNITSFVMHSRLATCEKGLHNNHPMWHPVHRIAMIHNGQIYNHEEFPKEISRLDSEALLHAYKDANLNESLDNIQSLADRIDGYYACAAYAPDANDRYVLDFFRDHRARMEAAFVHELGAAVFCTDSDIIKDTCKELKWAEPMKYAEVAKGVVVRFDPLTGEVLDKSTFEPNSGSSGGGTFPATCGSNGNQYGPGAYVYGFANGQRRRLPG